MKSLRVGLLGAGYMGRLHAKNLTAMRGVVLDCVCGLPLDTAQRLGADIAGGKAACFDDFDKMLRQRPIDALYVCIPPFAHDGQVEKAARKGIHLFLEKPIALTVKCAESMVRAIEKAGVVSQVGYHMRFAEPVRRLKKMIDSGAAGMPMLMQGRFFCNALHSSWWQDASMSGGQIFEQAIHVYDLALHLMGRPELVSAFADNLGHRNLKGYTIEDNSASIIRFESGGIASIAASNCAVPTAWTADFRVVCKNLTADFTDTSSANFYYTNGKPSEYFWKTGKKVRMRPVARPVDVYLQETRNFIAAVRGTEKPVSPARQGLEGVRLVSAAVESAKSAGKCVRI